MNLLVLNATAVVVNFVTRDNGSSAAASVAAEIRLADVSHNQIHQQGEIINFTGGFSTRYTDSESGRVLSYHHITLHSLRERTMYEYRVRVLPIADGPIQSVIDDNCSTFTLQSTCTLMDPPRTCQWCSSARKCISQAMPCAYEGSEWSEWRSFRSLYSTGTTRLAIYGDMGVFPSQFDKPSVPAPARTNIGNLVDDVAAGRVDFIVHSGDHAYEFEVWAFLFLPPENTRDNGHSHFA